MNMTCNDSSPAALCSSDCSAVSHCFILAPGDRSGSGGETGGVVPDPEATKTGTGLQQAEQQVQDPAGPITQQEPDAGSERQYLWPLSMVFGSAKHFYRAAHDST